jgi:hypothetical protein
LGGPVTDERIALLYNNALLVLTDFPSEEREAHFDCVASLCIVQCTKGTNGSLTYTGSCSQYFKDTYCTHAAIFYYEKELTSLTCEVPHQRKGNNCIRRQQHPHSNKRLLHEKYTKIFDQIFKIYGTIFHVQTTSDTEQIVRMKNIVKHFPTVALLREKIGSMNKIEMLRCNHLADQALTGLRL